MTEPATQPDPSAPVDPNGLDLVLVRRVRDDKVMAVDPVSANSMVTTGRATLVDAPPVIDPNLVATTIEPVQTTEV